MLGTQVQRRRGDLYEIRVGDHTFVAVPPIEYTEGDWPTRQEFFVAGVATFAAFHAERFLRHHGLPVEGLKIECEVADDGGSPEWIRSITLHVTPPADVDEKELPALLDAIRNGTSFDFLGCSLDVRTFLACIKQAAFVP